MTSNLPSRFEACLRNEKLVFPGDKIFIACSGGPDSVALFHLLRNLTVSWKIRLGLIHFHHGLRGREADRDARFVQKLARKYGVRFVIGYAKSRGKLHLVKKAQSQRQSLEEAAREVRYDFFAKACRKYKIKKIALAHTKDDQAETVLMRILQGTGPRGLSGIRTQMTRGKTVFVRPLLSFTKKEILKYLRENRYPYCRDSSNNSLRFYRNKIRKKLIPWLSSEFNPRVIEALSRLPAIVQEENSLIEKLEEEAFEKCFDKKNKTQIVLSSRTFLKLAAPLQFRVLNRALQSLNGQSGLDFEAWNHLRHHLSKRVFRYSLPRDIDFLLSPTHITLYKKKFSGSPASKHPAAASR